MTDVLDETTWRARADAHAARLAPYVDPHLARRAQGVKHPVHDFLFTYYSQRPAQLLRWHPGFGVALGGDTSSYAGVKGYVALGGGFETGAGAPSSTTVASPLGGGFETGAGAPSSTTGQARAVEEGPQQPSSTTGQGSAVEGCAPPRGGFETGAGAPSSTTGQARAVEEGPQQPSSTTGQGSAVEEVAQQPSRNPVTVSESYVASQRPLVEQLHRLLTATAARHPQLGCFGLHEWAMVYRLEEDETRHAAWPLRLGGSDTDRVVESHRITCTHFDAFRFFTPPARPLNTLQPGQHDRPDFEQPGCLHGGMDLYKHAFRLSPMISSDLVADCFELAWDIRILDMRAAPYDLTGTVLDPSGDLWTPVRIETAEGKREYADAQARFAERGASLRQRLIDECARLLAAGTGTSPVQ